MSFNEFVVDASGNLIEVGPGGECPPLVPPDRPGYRVTFDDGRTAVVEGADAFQPEGNLVTFFARGSSRAEIDSWSTRLASYRAATIVSIERADAVPARSELQVAA